MRIYIMRCFAIVLVLLVRYGFFNSVCRVSSQIMKSKIKCLPQLDSFKNHSLKVANNQDFCSFTFKRLKTIEKILAYLIVNKRKTFHLH